MVRTWALEAFGALVISAAAWAQAPAAAPAWEQFYSGPEATGPAALGCWQFAAGSEINDAAGRGLTLTLRGHARYADGGRFGNRCLETFGTDPADAPGNGAQVSHASLNPPGAFTAEIHFRAKPELTATPAAMLLDKKYYNQAKDIPEANTGYCLFLSQVGEGRWRLGASLGFGKDSMLVSSTPVAIEPGKPYHAALTYSGTGVVRLFLNGECIGRAAEPERGPLAPSTYPLIIGDRVASSYQGFAGFVDQVRVSTGVPTFLTGRLTLAAAAGRSTFVRLEPKAELSFAVGNDTGRPLRQVRARVAVAGLPEQEIALADLAADASQPLVVPLDTRLRPDRYSVKVALSAALDGGTVVGEGQAEVVIVPRPLPYMPVINWGSGDIPSLKEIGYTHNIIGLVDYKKVFRAGAVTDPFSPSSVAATRKQLDEHLANGLYTLGYFYPGHWLCDAKDADTKPLEKWLRVDTQGKPYERRDICCRVPELVSYFGNVAASVAQAYGDHPAFDGALINSEVRDGSNLCFHDSDRAACRAETGRDMPPGITAKTGLRYDSVAGFPANRILPDDDPALAFLRWFWKDGDGWNPMHSVMNQALKAQTHPGFWTFYDPATRTPSVWGSGGDVDTLSQWTYTYPDPLKMGQETDELFAMAEGRGQRVMKMTQIIWYRDATAPKPPEKEADRKDWEKQQPDAQFITIAPDHLREAFWCKIARPITGIMYHGWTSLVPGTHSAYRFTNPETRVVLTELTRDVVRPLGPMLLQVPDRPADVAILHSFASEMYASRGSWGGGWGWEADVHLILQWAGLQPRILYEEGVVRDGLDAYRVLVLPNCDVLPQAVYERIRAFQRRGGLLIADSNLTPALMPDILLPPYHRTKQPRDDKQALQKLAADLWAQLAPVYRRYGESSDPDVVVRCRRYGTADYLFAINDKRTFGDYVGQHGLVMEKGVADSATLRVARPGAAVYDLRAHKAVAARPTADGVEWEAALGPGDGGLFLLLDRPLQEIRLTAPAAAAVGGRAEVVAEFADAGGTAVAAVLPVQIEILDPLGRSADGSGFHAAKDGRLALTLEFAPNDLAGAWRIRVTDLASGLAREAALTLTIGP